MEWISKEIIGGKYIVYSNGTIYSNISKKFLKPINNGNDYLLVCLRINGKSKKEYIHRLVAKCFLDNPSNLKEINHLDENRKNNNLSNLEWCTSKYNKNYGNRAKKFSISRGKKVICVETGNIYHGIREAMRQTGINASDICACCNGYRNSKTAGGFHWNYY